MSSQLSLKADMQPTREVELAWLAELSAELGRPALLAGMDEVGRGALGGPVAVGVAIIGSDAGVAPDGLADSKLLSAVRRENLYQPCRSWAVDCAVGWTSARTLNSIGVMESLRRAGLLALATLARRGIRPDAVLLDGNYNWLAGGGASLFPNPVWDDGMCIPVRTVIKGDARCSVIAAASVVAKVDRDAAMVELDRAWPGYSWASNKGYASADHIQALERLGPAPDHRTAWHLPGRVELAHG